MMKSKLVNLAYPLLIVLLVLFISAKTFVPGTYLSGWDNLHPEFNFPLNIYRSLSSVWQEYQGLGLLGGMAHAADLPRQLILWFLSIFLPNSLLRYTWVFAMLALGPLGVYYLVKDRVLDYKKHEFANSLIALVSSVFYLLNPVTIQTFFTPYESFVTFYGFFPWLIFLALKYLKNPKKSNLLRFFAVSLLATSAFYVQTFFIVYVAILTIFFLNFLLNEGKKSLKVISRLLVVLFAVNAFWILPVGYFAFTNSNVVENSKINSIATPETQLMNAAFGNLSNISQLKGFWFDYMDLSSGKFGYLMQGWRDYLSSPWVQRAGVVLFGIALVGLVYSLKKRKKSFNVSFLVIFLLSFFMLAGENPSSGFIYSFIKNIIPFFGEIFRSPFTKWSLPLSLSLAVGLGYFAAFFSNLLKKRRMLLVSLVSVIILGLIAFTSLPVFEGKLIDDNLKIKIPDSYFELFDYLNDQPQDKRIAFFPIQSFWGWNFYSWNYRGSGFLWYGIKQPILDRAFDVWSKYDEGFYNEISTALYGDDPQAFIKVLSKYDVSYALLDTSIIDPEGNTKALDVENIENLLEHSGAKVAWSEGSLELYDLDNVTPSGFVYAPDNYSLKDTRLDYARYDPLYTSFGNYINGGDFYPFLDLSKENADAITYSADGSLESINIKRQISEGSVSTLVIPGLTKGETISVPVKVWLDSGKLNLKFENLADITTSSEVVATIDFPDVSVNTQAPYSDVFIAINNQIFDLKASETTEQIVNLVVGEQVDISIFDKNKLRKIDLSEDFENQEVNKCWVREGTDGTIESERVGDVLRITTKDAAGCLSFKLATSLKKSLLSVSLPYKSEGPSRPHFCILKEGEQVNCENKEVFYSTPPSPDWTEVERRVLLNDGITYWLAIAGRPSDKKGESTAIDYKAPLISEYPLSERITLTSDIWDPLLSERSVHIGESPYIEISLKTQPQTIDFRKSLNEKNCDVLQRGSIEKNINSDWIEYKASDSASICDVKALEDISNKNSYLLRIAGEGLEGRGMKMYLYNKTSGRNDLEVLLPDKEFDESYAVLSWENQDEGNYDLRFETRSFGSGDSANLLESVRFYPLPMDWLLGIHLTKQEGGISGILGNGKGNLAENNLVINGYTKTGTYKYIVDTKGYGLIVLSQGYDKGWIAFPAKALQFPFSNFQVTLPQLNKSLEHVKVNSWKNGWIIPNDSAIQKNSGSILIIFWPQYLEFLGFGILLAGAIYLFVTRKQSRLK